MPGQLKVRAFITFMLAVLFYLFFQISKHNPALSHVNAFAEDPYDAVGSFGVQLAVFTALLSLVRAFRPYQPKQALDSQKVLLLRSLWGCFDVLLQLFRTDLAPILWSRRTPAMQPGVAPRDQPGQECHAQHRDPDGGSSGKKCAKQPRAQPPAEQGDQRPQTEQAQTSTTHPRCRSHLRRVRQRTDEQAK
jgi:hypothetical protein